VQEQALNHQEHVANVRAQICFEINDAHRVQFIVAISRLCHQRSSGKKTGVPDAMMQWAQYCATSSRVIR
jgi:hypothetical protein